MAVDSSSGDHPRRQFDCDGRRERRGLLARIAITLALVCAVGWQIDFGAFLARMGNLEAGWTFLAFASVWAAIVLSAWKWGLVLAARRHALAFPRLVRHFLVGLFFNNVLPTTVGGDAVRAWEASRDTGEIPEATASVLTDRLIAGGALGFTALLGLPFLDSSPRLTLLVAVFLALDLVLIGLFVVPGVANAMVSKLLPPRFVRLRTTVSETVAAVAKTLRTPGVVARVAVLSVLFQVLVAAVNFCIFKAIGTQVSFGSCVVLTPMIFTVTMLPISLSGLGVREAAYWYFFAQVGVGQTDAVLASLAFFVIVGLCSLPGAPLYLLGGSRSVLRPTHAPMDDPGEQGATRQLLPKSGSTR